MRHNFNKILILSGFLFAIAGWKTVYAAQPVIFKPAVEFTAQGAIVDFVSMIEGFSRPNTDIAQVDLNNDDIYEYIVKNTRCTPAKGCAYLIVAQNKDDYTIIGTFSGKNISISDKQTHGIRDILVYNEDLNDYRHNTLKWNMQKMQYDFNQEQAG